MELQNEAPLELHRLEQGVEACGNRFSDVPCLTDMQKPNRRLPAAPHHNQFRNALLSFYGRLAALAMVLAIAIWGCRDPASPANDPDFAGTWLGMLEADSGAPIRLVFILGRKADSGSDGSLTGSLDSPDQGSIGIPLSSIRVAKGRVEIRQDDIGFAYSGAAARDGNSIEGTFRQAGESLPLLLRRQSGPVDYRRPQDPVPPYPYRSEDVSFPGPRAGMELAGTLAWPEGTGPFPTVLLIPGSGRLNRNEEIANHRPFLVLADALARAGIATLRVDKRGIGRSTGSYAEATSMDFAEDARSAIAFLRRQSRFEIGSLGALGHSEGGIVAPLVAAADPGIDFLVLLAAPAIPGDELLIRQKRAISAAQGASAEELDAGEALDRRVYACLREEGDPSRIGIELRAILEEAGLAGAELEAEIARLDTPWMRAWVAYDPAPALRSLRLPVLALAGSLDMQVPPRDNLGPLATALESAGPGTKVREMDGLNHLFQRAVTGSPEEYGSISQTLEPEAWGAIIAWIKAL